MKGSGVLSSSSNRASTHVEHGYQQQQQHYQHYQHQPSSPVTQRSRGDSQPLTRARSGTEGSTHSDTVRFHRDVFMKGVDKDARVCKKKRIIRTFFTRVRMRT
jgi:hypothetical protein